MEYNNIFRIPTNQVDVSEKVDPISTPIETVKVETSFNKNEAELQNLYAELTAISEEVISCRNAALEKA